MRIISLTLVVTVLMLTSSLKADYDVFPVTDSNAVNPANPAICGDWIVWQDSRNTATAPDIYGYTLAEPNEIEICLVSNAQEVPAVDGQYVVWQDYRNAKREIRVFDLLSRSEPAFPNLTMNNLFHKQYPDISGNLIVWQDKRNGDTDIYMYDITTDTETAVYNDGGETWGQYYPAVDGTTVVWQDTRHSNYQIYACALGGSPYRVHANSKNQQYPSISGDWVVWEEVDGSSHDVTVVVYNKETGAVWSHLIESETAAINAFPSVCDGIVVWQEYNGSDFDICGYDAVKNQELAIATEEQNGSNPDDRTPSISGRRIVWQRDGSAIVGAEIPSPIQVNAPVAGQMVLANSEMRISWSMPEGTPPDVVKIELIVNDNEPNTIIEDIAFGDFEYIWPKVADVNSIDSCQIQVVATSGAVTSGISGTFSIFQCDSNLTADLTGDCLVNIADIAELARQWLACGNPYDEDWCFE